MKKNKTLLRLSIFGSLINSFILPLTMISCIKEKEDNKIKIDKKDYTKLNQIKKEYKNTYKIYNDQIKKYANDIKDKKNRLDAEADNLKEIIKLKKEINDLYNLASNELNKIVNKYNNLFNELREEENKIKSDIRTVRIFHTNDEHGRIEFDDSSDNLYAGILKIGQYLKNKKYDILVSSGDLIQGLPLSDADFGKSIALMAKNIGYDSITIGNHEFDFGLDNIIEIDKENQKGDNVTPFISANIYYKDYSNNQIKPNGYDQTKVGQRVFKPYIIKELLNGIKVAIFGITSPDTFYTSHPKNSELVEFKEPVEATKEVINEIKEQHKDISFFIATTHLGNNKNQYE